MGMSIEFNWYIVTDKKDFDDKRIVKTGIRQYPIDIPLPLILKDDDGKSECIGLYTVTDLKYMQGYSLLYIKKITNVQLSQTILDHYNSMYRNMKFGSDIDGEPGFK